MLSFGMIQRWLAWWGALFVLYLLLTCTIAVAEVVVGAVAAALATAAAEVAQNAGGLKRRPRLSWIAKLARLPWRVLVDCGILGLALYRRVFGKEHLEGSFHAIPFAMHGQDAVSVARRAMITASISLAPNTYVVALDRQRNLLLVHQLIPSPHRRGKSDKEWPL